jgi:uncharacterized protein YkwD
MKTTIFLLLSVSFLAAVSFTSKDDDELRKDILKYTNKLREKKRLPALIIHDDLNDIADKHSKNMASGKVSFGHGGFDQRSATVRKKLDVESVAENVAFGVNSGKAVVDLWETSRGHRMNMLGDFKYIGIGIAKDKRGTLYYTEIFAR